MNSAKSTNTTGTSSILVIVELLPLEFTDEHEMVRERKMKEDENEMLDRVFVSEGLIENWGMSIGGPTTL